MSCLVTPASYAVQSLAKSVALDLGLTYVHSIEGLDSGVALVVDTDRSWLQRLQRPRLGRVSIDFAAPEMLYRRKSGHNEPLGRAVGVKHDVKPRVFDATAGLGRDAFVLADLGCDVVLSEWSVPLGFLLNQARELALLSAHTKVVEAADHMTVVTGDSCERALQGFDAIYIDPMFPERGKSAAVKKDLATVQALFTDAPGAPNAEALLAWAVSQPVDRVVIKRPVKAPSLGVNKPSHSITGKTVRFDVIVK